MAHWRRAFRLARASEELVAQPLAPVPPRATQYQAAASEGVITTSEAAKAMAAIIGFIEFSITLRLPRPGNGVCGWLSDYPTSAFAIDQSQGLVIL
jgi:hypothetical protein